MEELLGLKWNNHASAFLDALATLRSKDKYCDATIACDDQLYKVHKVILSTCSEYFRNIFDQVSGSDLVIIVNDISCKDFESLLDYMYMGETNVQQNELSSLIKAANYLKVKGFLTSDNNDEKMAFKHICKRLINDSSGPWRKKKKTAETVDNSSNKSDSPSDFSESEVQSNSENLNPMSVVVVESKVFVSGKNSSKEIDEFEESSLKSEINEVSLMENLEPELSLLAEDNLMEESYIIPPHLLEGGGESSASQNIYLEKSIKQLQNTCNVCGKSFGKRYDLDRHTRIHTGEKPYQCLYCLFRGRQKSHVINHILSVHQDIPGSTSVTTSDLSQSEPTLSSDGKEQLSPIDPSRICRYCGKVFMNKYRCIRHTLIHTNEKSHKCTQCTFCTRRKEDLVKHTLEKH